MLLSMIFANDEVSVTIQCLCTLEVELSSTSSCRQITEISPPAVTPLSVTLLPVLIWNEWSTGLFVLLLLPVRAHSHWGGDTSARVVYNVAWTISSHVCTVQLLLVSFVWTSFYADARLFWKPPHSLSCVFLPWLLLMSMRIILIDGDKQRLA